MSQVFAVLDRDSPRPRVAWTIVRDPTARALSYYRYFCGDGAGERKHCTVIGAAEGDPIKGQLDFIKRAPRDGQLSYLAPIRYDRAKDADRLVDEVFEAFDFVAVAERFEESMIVLAGLLNATLGDVLYIASKMNEATAGHDRFAARAPMPDVVAAAVAKRNLSGHGLDAMLYRRANHELSRQVDSSITTRRSLHEFEAMLQLARSRCVSERANTADRECLWNDNGCFYRCLDKIAANSLRVQ